MRFLRRRCAVLSLLVLMVAGTALPASAAESAEMAYITAMRDGALRSYGWRSDAISYIVRHTRLVSTPGGDGSPCPSAVACAMPNGSVFVNMTLGSSRAMEYVLNHEYIHAMEFARGSNEATVGRILADVLALSQDQDYPAAAYAARRVLDLTVGENRGLIGSRDWFHIEHDILEDVGWDVGNLPGWYRDAYFPYLMPGPDAAKPVSAARNSAPADADARAQVVVDTIVSLCGPVLPGARTATATIACTPPTGWAAVPYGLMAGGAAPARAPIAPVQPAAAVASTQPAAIVAQPQPNVVVAPTQPSAGVAQVQSGAEDQVRSSIAAQSFVAPQGLMDEAIDQALGATAIEVLVS